LPDGEIAANDEEPAYAIDFGDVTVTTTSVELLGKFDPRSEDVGQPAARAAPELEERDAKLNVHDLKKVWTEACTQAGVPVGIVLVKNIGQLKAVARWLACMDDAPTFANFVGYVVENWSSFAHRCERDVATTGSPDTPRIDFMSRSTHVSVGVTMMMEAEADARRQAEQETRWKAEAEKRRVKAVQVKAVAADQGRIVQAVVDEVMRDYVKEWPETSPERVELQRNIETRYYRARPKEAQRKYAAMMETDEFAEAEEPRAGQRRAAELATEKKAADEEDRKQMLAELQKEVEAMAAAALAKQPPKMTEEEQAELRAADKAYWEAKSVKKATPSPGNQSNDPNPSGPSQQLSSWYLSAKSPAGQS